MITNEVNIIGTITPSKVEYTRPMPYQEIQIIRTHGIIHNVLADGNCEYRAAIKGLISLKKLRIKLLSLNLEKDFLTTWNNTNFPCVVLLIV